MNPYLISEERLSDRSAVGRLVLFGIENSDLLERRKARYLKSGVGRKKYTEHVPGCGLSSEFAVTSRFCMEKNLKMACAECLLGAALDTVCGLIDLSLYNNPMKRVLLSVL